MTDKNDLCYVCGKALPYGQGKACYHARLCIRVCYPACSEKASATQRIYDRSARGRRRPAREVLAILREAREAQRSASSVEKQ